MAKFADRLELALMQNEMRARDLCEALGISEGLMSNYRSGRFVPRRDRVNRIAEVLNVKPEWLLGYTPVFPPEEEEISLLFKSLCAEYRQLAVDYMRFLKKKQDEKE